MSRGLAILAAVTGPLAGLALLCAAPAHAQPQAQVQPRSKLQPTVTEGTPAGFRANSQALVLQPINLDVSRFAFTAPGRVTSSRVQTVERGFSFTPSRDTKGVSVGATVRSVMPSTAAERTAAAETVGITPAGYNFDLSVGYRGVSVSGGVARVDGGLGGRSSESVDVGLGYGAQNWQAGIAATAEREEGFMVAGVGTPDPRYSLEARGALALSPKVSLGGSVRYRPAPQNPTPLDPNKDDRAVMLGGAVAF